MGKAGNWFWAVPTQRAKEVLALFLKLAVVRGAHYGEVLEEVLGDYNRKFLEHTGLSADELVEEADLLEALSYQGVPVSRRTLWKHRKNGHLTAADGTPLFYQSGHKVVYNLPRCISFYKEATQA